MTLVPVLLAIWTASAAYCSASSCSPCFISSSVSLLSKRNSEWMSLMLRANGRLPSWRPDIHHLIEKKNKYCNRIKIKLTTVHHGKGHLDLFYFMSSHPVERHRGHPVPVALEVDVSCLLVDAHGKVSIIHPQGRLHCCLWVITNSQSILMTYLKHWHPGGDMIFAD